jgi:hypothetical protein
VGEKVAEGRMRGQTAAGADRWEYAAMCAPLSLSLSPTQRVGERGPI